jgi:hypothetical protein
MPLALACALVVAFAVALAQTKPPTFTVESEGGLPQYGMQIAADGSTLATPDIDGGTKHLLLQFDRVVNGTLVREARIDLGNLYFISSVALRGDTAVVTSDLNELVFFERRGTSWREAQRLALPSECRAYFVHALALGDGVAVVASMDLWCFLERRGSGWEITMKIEKTFGTSVAVSKKRVLLRESRAIYQYVLGRDGWARSKLLAVPGDHVFVELAASERWLVVTDEWGTLYVYDLDDRARMKATIKGDYQERKWIDVGPRLIATTGEKGARAYYLDGKQWRDGGKLEGAATRGYPGEHPVVVGDHVWIGDPDTAQFQKAGRVHGFVVR